MNTFHEGQIVTERFILGPRDVKIITLSAAMNYAVIQFRDLDRTPSGQNTYAVVLSKLQPKAR